MASHTPDWAVLEALFAPPERMPAGMADGAHPDAEVRTWFEERAAILEYDGGLPRAETERRAALETEQRFGAMELRRAFALPWP